MPSAGGVAGKVVFCICGPIGSLCCFVISVWGVLMLFLLGIFYYIKAVVLFEDLLKTQFVGLIPIEHDHIAKDGYWNKTTTLSGIEYFDPQVVTDAYHSAAFACWGAGVIYLAFMILSGTFLGINAWRAKVAAR